MAEGKMGTVKAWIEGRGMGFITPADGSPDVFVHRSNLTDGMSLVIGSEVVFEPGWDNSKQKPIAIKCSGATGLNHGGGFGGKAPAALKNGQPGVVKAWLDERGMGFITPADGSPDVFVHRSNLVDGSYLQVGAQVMYEAGWDQSKNKPIAKAVSGALGTSSMVPNGQPGVVKAWIEGRGMGFITPADGSDDVFVHRSNLIDGDMLVIGSQVFFEAGYDPQKGKPIAKVCSGAAVSGAGMGMGGFANGHGQGNQGPLTGTVKVWFADKGYGFITLDHGMGDAFVGSGALPHGMALREGMHIAVNATWNPQKQTYTAVEVLAGGNGRSNGFGAPTQGAASADNCFVTSLPLDITEEKLKQLFSAYGNVVNCKVLPGAGRPDRAALVRFSTAEEAKWIVENVNGAAVPGLGSPVSVKFATQKYGAGPGPAPGPGFFPSPLPPSQPQGYGPSQGKGHSGRGSGVVVPPPSTQVQAALVGTVKAVMENSMVVTTEEGDLHVPNTAILDGSREIGGLVSFSKEQVRSGKGSKGGAGHRASPYGMTSPGQAKGGHGTGTVKAWMEHRGMGFIAPSDGSQDLFVHRSYLADGGSLMVGSQVTFTPQFDMQKGKAIAVNVYGAVPKPGVPGQEQVTISGQMAT